jgi:hypothetical protein
VDDLWQSRGKRAARAASSRVLGGILLDFFVGLLRRRRQAGEHTGGASKHQMKFSSIITVLEYRIADDVFAFALKPQHGG